MVQSLISSAFGGVLGAYIIYLLSKRNSRILTTIQVIEKADRLIKTIEESYDILLYDVDRRQIDNCVEKNQIESWDEEKKRLGSIGRLDRDGNTRDQNQRTELYDKVCKCGDFLNYVAFLRLYGKVSEEIISKSILEDVMIKFPQALDKYSFLVQTTFMITPWYDRDGFPYHYEFVPWQKGWPFLFDFKRKENYGWIKLREIIF